MAKTPVANVNEVDVVVGVESTFRKLDKVLTAADPLPHGASGKHNIFIKRIAGDWAVEWNRTKGSLFGGGGTLNEALDQLIHLVMKETLDEVEKATAQREEAEQKKNAVLSEMAD